MPDPDSSPEHEGRGFLSRWSERKIAVRDGVAVDDGADDEQTAAPGQAFAAPKSKSEPKSEPKSEQAPTHGLEQDPEQDQERTGEPALTDADMPPLEDLDADSDYSGFLSRGVSESLRNQALKKLFFSGPFNVVDGLDDYAEDFTQFAALGDIVTAEMRHRLEEAAKRAAAEIEKTAAADPVATEEASAPAVAAPDGEHTEATPAPEPGTDIDAEEQDEDV